MSQQYRRVNMAEVNRVLDAMQPGGAYTSDYLADVTGMDWRRVIFALLKRRIRAWSRLNARTYTGWRKRGTFTGR